MSGLDVVVPSAAPVEGVLERTLPALRAAADRAGATRVWLVDDVGPRPALAALTAELGITYLVGQRRGPGPARNVGAAEGTSSLLCFVDDDVVLDPDALSKVPGLLGREDVAAVVGGLRAPAEAPPWLVETYTWATLTPASALAPEGALPFVSLATGLVAMRRDAWADAGGFPDVFGMEDTIFGLRLGAARPGGHVERRHELSGVHLYLPTWEQWLARSWSSGDRLRQLLPTLEGEAQEALLAGRALRGGGVAAMKRSLGRLPPRVLLGLTGSPLLRRLAAAGAGARGFSGRGWT